MTSALLTDRYEFTMVEAALKAGTADRRCVFELFARRLPQGRRYGLVAGTGRFLAELTQFRFGDAELAWLRDGDMIRIDLVAGTCDALVDADEIARRKTEPAPPIPPSNSPWEELYREKTGQLAQGGVLDFAVKYRGIAAKTPRHNH